MRAPMPRTAWAAVPLLLALAAHPSNATRLPAGDTGVRDASGGSTSRQIEQTLAVDPTDERNVLIAFNSGLTVSHDGGRTWHLTSQTCVGDSNPVFDAAGTAYVECDNTQQAVFRSPDKGDHWVELPNPIGVTDNNGDVIDRPWLVAGPRGHQLAFAWESFYGNPLGWVYVKTSEDGGRTWSARRRVDDPSSATDYASMDPRQYLVVGVDRTLYVAYASSRRPEPWPDQADSLFTTSYVVARSRDDGASFTRSTAATGVVRSSAPTEESEAISSLAADPSPRRASHLALVWADERHGESRILVTTSGDGGRTWSAPVDVADDPVGHGNQHDHPQVRFAPDGRFVVLWRDRRCCGGGFDASYHLYVRAFRLSGRGAARAVGRSVLVTDKAQPPISGTQLSDEYVGLVVGPEGVSVAWNQPKSGNAATHYRRIPLQELS